MGTHPRTTVLAALVAVLCFTTVVVKVARAPAPVPRRAATLAERAELARAIAAREERWNDESVQSFPRDLWSQRDDFHGRESEEIVKLADERGVRVEDVLRAIDEDIHRRAATSSDAPDDRRARAVPCKPRPFYD